MGNAGVVIVVVLAIIGVIGFKVVAGNSQEEKEADPVKTGAGTEYQDMQKSMQQSGGGAPTKNMGSQ
jgi:predicted negative regulator of RcsB-dependent stress response